MYVYSTVLPHVIRKYGSTFVRRYSRILCTFEGTKINTCGGTLVLSYVSISRNIQYGDHKHESLSFELTYQQYSTGLRNYGSTSGSTRTCTFGSTNNLRALATNVVQYSTCTEHAYVYCTCRAFSPGFFRFFLWLRGRRNEIDDFYEQIAVLYVYT